MFTAIAISCVAFVAHANPSAHSGDEVVRWDARAVEHLLNRAGFGATGADIARGLAIGQAALSPSSSMAPAPARGSTSNRRCSVGMTSVAPGIAPAATPNSFDVLPPKTDTGTRETSATPATISPYSTKAAPRFALVRDPRGR